MAGSHGKTTTTSMIALVLERAGLDPTAVIGGRLSAFGSNARLGRGEYMVAEADESDRSFLKLSPSIAVITNIDDEHLDRYGSFEDLQQAFVDFANKVPFYGAWSPARTIRGAGGRPAAHHAAGRHLRTGRRRRDGRGEATSSWERSAARCTVHRRAGDGAEHRLGPLDVAVPGRHNLLNALAAVAVAECLGRGVRPRSPPACAEFQGAERRFQRIGEARGVLVVDDYGHHPTEIAAVLAAARAGARPARSWSRSSRIATRGRAGLMDGVRRRRSRDADEVVLTDIYAAGEDPIAGRHVRGAGRRRSGGGTRRPVHVVARLDELVPALVARSPGRAMP